MYEQHEGGSIQTEAFQLSDHRILALCQQLDCQSPWNVLARLVSSGELANVNAMFFLSHASF